MAARHRIGSEDRDRIEPATDLGGIGQRRGEPLRQQPRAGGRDGAVDGGKERAAPLAGERANKFEIAAGGLVKRERRASRLACRRRERRPLAELRALHIGDRGRGRGQFDAGEGAERGCGRHAEKCRQPAFRGGAVEHIARQRRQSRKAAQRRRQLGIAIERIGDDDLAGLDSRNRCGERGAVAFGDAEFAGRNINPGQRETILACGATAARERGEIIVALGVEERIFGQRSGRDQPDNVAAHHAFGAAFSRLRRIFELLADRDAIAERDQSMQIFIGALDRHAAHRNVGPEMLAAFGQHDTKRARGDFGIIEEQFVEVAHPVEQQAIRIGRLDLDILLHHWCNAADFVGRYGRDARGVVGRFGRVRSRFSGDGTRSVHGSGFHGSGFHGATLANLGACRPALRQASTVYCNGKAPWGPKSLNALLRFTRGDLHGTAVYRQVKTRQEAQSQ